MREHAQRIARRARESLSLRPYGRRLNERTSGAMIAQLPTMGAFVYGFTKHGVMVQLQLTPPTDKEWAEMLAAIESRSNTLKSALAVVRGEGGPSSKQREALARVLKSTRPDLRFALVTDSVLVRGVLTAINWLTNKGNTTAAFPSRDLEAGLDFIQLSPEEKVAVRELLRTLESGAREPVAATR